MSDGWLPQLVTLASCAGEWPLYEKVLYGCFTRDFLREPLTFGMHDVRLKRHPVEKDKEATFWHFVSEGETEADRQIDLRRCERIRWPRALMREFDEHPPRENERIHWWRNERGREVRYVLSLPDFSYVLVVAQRTDFVLPWTAYCVDQDHRRSKLAREWREFWQL